MLTFPLKKEEYEKIKSGKKTIKYLAVKPYWDNRLNKEFDSHCLPLHRYGLVWDANRTGTLHCCELRLGRANRYIAANITRIEIIDGQDTDLHIDKPVYAIHLANVKEVWEDNMTRRELNYYNYEIEFENSFILAKKCRLRR